MESNQPAPTPEPLALYLHIPFCHFKCYYCDFNTYAGLEPLLPLYVDALSTELRRWGQALRPSPRANSELSSDPSSPSTGEDTGGGDSPHLLRPSSARSTPLGFTFPSLLRGEGQACPERSRRNGGETLLSNQQQRQATLPPKAPIHTIFLGGGTPSLLSPAQLERILTTIAGHFALQPDAEITLEANPESVEIDKLRAYRALGVNRVSIGAQSFDNAELKTLGRLADSARVVAAYAELRAAGFDNVNLDLIYGLPHQTQETWSRTLSEALALAPEHLSLYALTVEERTPFHRWVQEGTLPLPDPDLAADMYEDACEALASAGYEQYEISNWARPGRACRHNLVYWRNGPFIGAGPGAHSFLPGARFSIIAQPREYIAAMKKLEHAGLPPTLSPDGPRLTDPAILKAIAPVDGFDPISEELEQAETLILGLRLNEGVSLATYAARHGRSPTDFFRSPIEDSIADGLLALHGDVLRLTPHGRLLANEVFVRVLSVVGQAGRHPQ